MARRFKKKINGNCQCGCKACSPLQFKQIRAYKSRMTGYAPLDLTEGEEYSGELTYYLNVEYSHSCAYPCGFGPGIAGCPDINRCDEICGDDCCAFEPVTSEYKYDRFRGCSKLQSECELQIDPNFHSDDCEEDEPTPTSGAIRCVISEDQPATCCESWESTTTLSQPYTETILEADIADMRDSVSWSEIPNNCGGDVIGLEEGNFIFPFNHQESFDAHFYTDEDVTYIDKAWLRIHNPTGEPVSIVKLFTPQDGGPAESEEIEIDAEESIEIDPPDTPGVITVNHRPCVRSLEIEKYCQARVGSGHHDDCYFCAYRLDRTGGRKMYRQEDYSFNGSSDVSGIVEFEADGLDITNNQQGSASYSVETIRKCDDGNTPNSSCLELHSVDSEYKDSYVNPSTGYGTDNTYNLNKASEKESCSDPLECVSYFYSRRSIVDNPWSPSDTYTECIDCVECRFVPWPFWNGSWILSVEGSLDFCSGNFGWSGGDCFAATLSQSMEVDESSKELTGSTISQDADWCDGEHAATFNYTASKTLSDRILPFEDDDEEIEEYSEEEECSAICVGVELTFEHEKPGYAFSDTKYRLVVTNVPDLNPEEYSSMTVVIRWYEIVYLGCDDGIDAELNQVTRTISRAGSPGAYSWPEITDVEGELLAQSAIGRKEGSACIEYVSAVLVSAVKA